MAGVGFFCLTLRVGHTVSLVRHLGTAEEYAQVSRSSYARYHVSDASSALGNGGPVLSLSLRGRQFSSERHEWEVLMSPTDPLVDVYSKALV